VLTVEIVVAGAPFTLLNGGPIFKLDPSLSFFVHEETAAEAERIFAVLEQGGRALMPIASYPWSERYG
jgi:predicted 3-demethylubiquinone-9 3-methyltransferase (glyoxalase superfamily)